MALERTGREHVLQHVGVEPSGEAFNSVELTAQNGRPFNPMVNAGAIAMADLIKQEPLEAGVAALVARLGDAAGRTLQIDDVARASESSTGNRNRAIAYLLRNFEIIDEQVEDTPQQYFTQCSVLMNTRDLAMIGATLANMGENPVTQKNVFDLR